MTNTNRDLHKRLLHLLQVDVVKKEFNEKGNQEDICEAITGNYSQHRIREFVFENYLITKQNIYLFDLDKVYNSSRFDSETFPLKIERKMDNKISLELRCLPKITYRVYLSEPTEIDELEFFQPITLKIQGKQMIVHFTKLEKNILSYFNPERQPKKASAENAEEASLAQIVSYFNPLFGVSPLDINKGVKHLWDIDDLDCSQLEFLKSSSHARETMNAKTTFKKQYPDDYKEIIKKPLGKSHWKYQKADQYFCETMVINPSIGEISIPRFPANSNQITNVIAKILSNN